MAMDKPNHLLYVNNFINAINTAALTAMHEEREEKVQKCSLRESEIEPETAQCVSDMAIS